MDHYKSLTVEKINQTNLLINLNLIIFFIIERQIIYIFTVKELLYYKICLYIKHVCSSYKSL